MAAAMGPVARQPRSGGARLLRIDRKLESGQESRPIVLEHQLTLVEMGDGFGERETEPRAFVRSTGIETAEAPPRLGQSLGWNAGAAIANLDANLAFAGLDPDRDFAAPRTVADRIFDEIAHRLRQQLAMPE